MNIRTDLALEMVERQPEETKGYSKSEKNVGSVKVTEVKITSQDAAESIGKPIGKYITIDTPEIKFSTEEYENACRALAEELKKMLPEQCKITLVAGLGNREITPDALGTEVVSNLMVTHHLKGETEVFADEGISSVCAIAPGVMGTTGMETVEIIKGVSERLEPDVIIAVDAMASADYNRICSTIQLCDTGVQPGAGVGNNRKALNEDFLGRRVIAVGTPTVIDANRDDGGEPMMVTPRDIDLVIKRMGKTIANGINLALHDVTLKEAEEYVG